MANVTRASDASPAEARRTQILSYPGAVDLAPCTPVYLDANYRWQKTNGTAANAAAICWGFTLKASKAGQVANVAVDPIAMYYGTGLVKDALLYVSTTAGELSDTATTGGTKPVAKVYDAQRGLIRSLATGLMV
jgi:hypothetical protein